MVSPTHNPDPSHENADIDFSAASFSPQPRILAGKFITKTGHLTSPRTDSSTMLDFDHPLASRTWDGSSRNTAKFR